MHLDQSSLVMGGSGRWYLQYSSLQNANTANKALFAVYFKANIDQ